MKTTLRYNITPSLGYTLYLQRICSKICSVKGVGALVGVFTFSYVIISIGCIPWNMELAPASRMWVFASFLIIALGFLPILYMVILCIVFAVRYIVACHEGAKTPSLQVTLTIDDDGFIFMSEKGKNAVAWGEVKNLEFLRGGVVFSYGNDIVFIPKKEIPDDVNTFIKSKTVHEFHETYALFDSDSGVVRRVIYAIKLVVYAILLVLAIGIMVMFAGFLSWTIFA